MSEYDRSDVSDPRYEIKFGNVGFGPMFIKQVQWYANGKPVKDLETVIGKEHQDWVITCETVMGKRFGKAFKNDAIIPLLVMRPREIKSSDEVWHDDARKVVTGKNLECEVTYSYFDTFPGSWFHRTKKLKLTPDRS